MCVSPIIEIQKKILFFLNPISEEKYDLTEVRHIPQKKHLEIFYMITI